MTEINQSQYSKETISLMRPHEGAEALEKDCGLGEEWILSWGGPKF